MIKLPEKLAVLGMGYVGTPLAIEFSNKFLVVGFDINPVRIEDLKKGIDSTNELDLSNVSSSNSIKFSSDNKDLKEASWFIVTVPTPVNEDNEPDFEPLINASKTAGTFLKKDGVVIYESTVYPGATEEICVPVLEKVSGLKFNKDFFCGYSPERINPGDKTHTLVNIKKVTSGSTTESADLVDELYASIIKAGTYKASSIKVAEAAKVIENSQRDLNIAFVNELSKIFSKLDIDTHEVLEAAKTKWNFLPFKPGLVGGHCIGVDPYYLSHKSLEIGYYPEIILSGRKINDSMSNFVFSEVLRLIQEKGKKIDEKTKVLILGATFKENCSDIRNSKVFDLHKLFSKKKIDVTIFDPRINHREVKTHYGLDCLESMPEKGNYDSVVLAVPHDEFLEHFCKIKDLLSKDGVIFDINGSFPAEHVDGRL